MRRDLALAVAFVTAAAAPAEARKRRRRRAPPKPIPTFRADGSPNVQSAAALAIDGATGETLFSRHADAVRPIASLSKLAAVLVIVEHGLKLADATTISADDARVARGGARSRLPVGFSFTNDDLLHAALLASDNRAVAAMGRSVGLDAPALAAAMTEKARALGLLHTRFCDPVGLDYGNMSTAREVIALLRAVVANPLLGRIMKTPAHVAMSVAPVRRAVVYRSTNALLRAPGVVALGGKTGFNALAGHCFVGAVRTPSGREVTAAFLGSHGKLTRFGDFGRLLAWIQKQDEARSVAANAAVAPTTEE